MNLPEPPTPQELAKGMKDVSYLRKVKFYCQLCRKQCGDRHGFRCHLSSDHHQKNIRLFLENPDKYIEEYSSDFEQNFLDLYKRKYYGARMLANKVYQDYIANPDHTHLNATKWTKLVDFVQHLHDTGKVEQEWTEQGLFIKYKENAPVMATKKKEEEKRLREIMKKEQREKEELERQLQIAKAFEEKQKAQAKAQEEEKQPQDLPENHEKIEINLSNPHLNKSGGLNPFASKYADVVSGGAPINQPISFSLQAKPTSESDINNKRRGLPGLEKVLETFKSEKKIKTNEEEVKDDGDIPWIAEGIIVKIKDKNLKKYYGKKAKIIRLVSDYVAQIETLEDQAKLEIDQELLETVIPKIGGKVKVLKQGPFFGKTGVMESIHQDSYSVSVLLDGSDVALELPYEFVSKLA